MKKGDVIEITWWDAEHIDDWKTPEEVERKSDDFTKNIGYFIKKDDRFLYFYTTILDSGKMDRWLIPVGCLIKIKKL